MASYQAPHNFDVNRGGENDNETQPGGSSHPAQHARSTTAQSQEHPPTTQIPFVNEAEEAIG